MQTEEDQDIEKYRKEFEEQSPSSSLIKKLLFFVILLALAGFGYQHYTSQAEIKEQVEAGMKDVFSELICDEDLFLFAYEAEKFYENNSEGIRPRGDDKKMEEKFEKLLEKNNFTNEREFIELGKVCKSNEERGEGI